MTENLRLRTSMVTRREMPGAAGIAAYTGLAGAAPQSSQARPSDTTPYLRGFEK
mgnify:FL=1